MVTSKMLADKLRDMVVILSSVVGVVVALSTALAVDVTVSTAVGKVTVRNKVTPDTITALTITTALTYYQLTLMIYLNPMRNTTRENTNLFKEMIG